MSSQSGSGELVRALDWKGAFWVAAGVPPLPCGGWMSTADLIHNLTALIDPQGPQINMISHEEAGGNIVREGYAEYERGGLQITDAGRAYLKKMRG